ncbi:hypothetical protein C8R42DRAFT_647280 [Lentinula raphanica]|nr:hypothetical protein C8R42DRAFT_647280 [Lentinula raphanica]
MCCSLLLPHALFLLVALIQSLRLWSSAEPLRMQSQERPVPPLLEGGVYYRLKNNLAMSDPNTFSVRTLEAKFDSPFDGDKEKKALYDHVPMAFTKCEWIIDGLDYWYRRSHDGQSLHESNKAALRFAITQVEEAERLTLTCGRE